MSDQIDPKDPNLAMAFTLNIAAMAIKIRNFGMHITANPGMLDDDARLKMAEAVMRVMRACDAIHTDLIIERKPQDWGPCAKCGSTYRFETLGPCGMDAFKVTKIVCNECGFTVHWHEDADQSAPHAWQRAAALAAHEKLKQSMEKLKAAGKPTDEEVEAQMRSSEKFKQEQDERDSNKR